MAIHLGLAALPVRLSATVAACTFVMAGAAQAALLSPVTVNLVAPGGIVGDATPISESASVNTATGLHAGDPGNLISSFWMLSDESITFSGNSILLHLVAGAGDASASPPVPFTTGYLGLGGDHARFEFAGLNVPGSTIIGFSYMPPPGILSGSNVSLVSTSQLNFDLDTLVFDTSLNQRTTDGYYYADFRINLITQPTVNVPEPAGWALVLGALAALHLSVRRKPGLVGR